MDYLLLGGDARMAYLTALLRQSGRDARHVADPMAAAALLPGAARVITNCPPKLGMDLDAVIALADPSAKLILCGPERHPEDGRIIDLWGDAALIAENARLTAEGAVCAAMRAGRRSLRDLPCLVIGWGRIGRALTELLVAMGARVTVASRDAAHRRRAIERGAEAVATQALSEALSRALLVFSTPPATVLDAEALKHANLDAMIVDLASPPYGVDLRAAWARGLRAWREPGLPGRYCPESAARALLDALARREGRP